MAQAPAMHRAPRLQDAATQSAMEVLLAAAMVAIVAMATMAAATVAAARAVAMQVAAPAPTAAAAATAIDSTRMTAIQLQCKVHAAQWTAIPHFNLKAQLQGHGLLAMVHIQGFAPSHESPPDAISPYHAARW